MIHPKAIQEFLTEERDNWAWIKRLTPAELDASLKDIKFEVAKPDEPLDVHQKACALLALAQPYFSFWLDMGTGKTRLMLEVMRYLIKRKELRQILVLCPSEQSVFTWEQEIARWKIDVPYIALGNSPVAEKWGNFAALEHGFIIVTYAGLVWMLSKKKKLKKDKIKLVRQDTLVKKFAALIDSVVMDESTKLGNQGSSQFQCVRAISKHAARRYALAGRPFGRDPTLVWSQQFLVDRGETLGDTLGLFRQAFFTEKKGYFGGYEYKFDKSMDEDLARMMCHRSISYASEECQTLPMVTDIIEKVRLPEDAQAYYEKAVQAIIKAKGNPGSLKNIFLRMRQISSGFLGFKDDETGARAQLVFPHNPKLERLLELVDEVPLDRKFVIFHEFTYTGNLIQEQLAKRLNITAGWLHGGIKNSAKIQTDFNTKPKVRGLIVNNWLGSMSLNLQIANYCFVAEAPVSPIDWDQLRKRCFRKGQVRPGFLYDLRVKGTVDDKIRQFHAEGESLMKAVLRDPYILVK